MPDTRRTTTALQSSAVGFRALFDTLKPAPEQLHTTATNRTVQEAHGLVAGAILLVDSDNNHAQHLTQLLQWRGLFIEQCHEVRNAVRRLRQQAGRYALVIVNISDSSRPWELMLHDLQEAAAQARHHQGPLFLGISRTRKSLHFQLMLERRGYALPTRSNFGNVLESVDLLLLELKMLLAVGPHFKILHHYRQPGSDCAPGEEVAGVYLVHRAKEFLIHLSCPLLLVFDYLGHHSHLPQTASQIVSGLRANPFYQKHGANTAARLHPMRRIGRSSLKVYIQRLRGALGEAFHDAQLQLDPYNVLVSEETSSNVAAYRMRATFEWIHVDHPGSREEA